MGCAHCSSSECICAGLPSPTPEFDSAGRRRYRYPRDVPFNIVIEARPGTNGVNVGTTLLPTNQATPPHLQVLVDRALGDGDPAVDCRTSVSARDWGGVPGTSPLVFSADQATVNTITDLTCRFGVFDSQAPCTLDRYGDPGFLNPNPTDTSIKQFCHLLLRSDLFPVGDTILAARVLDISGVAGPIAEIVIRVSP